MGRGRNGVLIQGDTKINKKCGRLLNRNNKLVRFEIKPQVNQTVVDLPENVLNKLRQMNPREVANILVNMEI